jgi:integrase
MTSAVRHPRPEARNPAPRWVTSGAPRRVADLTPLLDHDLLAQIGWDQHSHLLIFPADHLLVGWPRCRTDGCEKKVRDSGYCGSCRPQSHDGRDARKKSVGIGPCAVPGCERPWANSPSRLCHTHLDRKKRLQLSMDDFLADPKLVAFGGYGVCQVAACPRDRDCGENPYCTAHRRRWNRARRADPGLDEAVWRKTITPISENNEVSLRGLPEPIRVEILYGLQERVRAGIMTRATVLRSLTNLARQQRAGTLERVAVPATNGQVAGLRRTMLRFVQCGGLDVESEIAKDVWHWSAFGSGGGHLRFDRITQAWLREAAKRWVLDDAPRRRGAGVRQTIQSKIAVLQRLSESLAVQRRDRGNDITALGRADVVAFLNRLAYLADTGAISPRFRYQNCMHARLVLATMRAIGLTRPGEPLHGLPDDFSFRLHDTPREPADEPGRDLPVEIMRQLCAALPTLDSRTCNEGRLSVELLIDTGRRPGEVCGLPYDCLQRDHDGNPVLIYDNIKANRPGRRLPISEATAALIVAQQQRVRQRFPNTPLDQLKLLPSPIANPHGRRPIGEGHVSKVHRDWVDAIPELRTADGTEFDRSAIVLYAYRHTYAQRHADAGVPADVLRELMNHRMLTTTQRYYRIGEQRRREAVERVAHLQFDRHGSRVWRDAKALMDSEHARRAVGEVAVPYGLCSEPSNVAAAGNDCPVRYRCVGCGHFRTDVSYLPDLQAHLDDLLHTRERVIAAVDMDDWARVQATPSDDEIQRVRWLIERISGDLDDLQPEDRREIDEAVAVIRRHRANTVMLGLPRHRQAVPDIRTEVVA